MVAATVGAPAEEQIIEDFPQSPDERAQAADGALGDEDPIIEELRQILFDRYRGQIDLLEEDVERLRATLDKVGDQINDREGLITTLKPALADAIGASIHDSRDAMVNALYPIMGRLVTRAVAESIRDLARSIDAQMRNAFSFRMIMRRTKARASGVSDSTLLLRDALPFHVEELFLIHSDSGLVLAHAEDGSLRVDVAQSKADSEIIGGMLTAIHSFVEEAFGRGEEGSLDEVQYGRLNILIETSTYAYMACVVRGVAPHGLRAELRSLLVEIEHEYGRDLRAYGGDAARFADAQRRMQMFVMQVSTIANEQPTDRRRASHRRSNAPPPSHHSLTTDAVHHPLPVSLIVIFLLCSVVVALSIIRLVNLLNGGSV
jgi:hypothetical protein